MKKAIALSVLSAALLVGCKGATRAQLKSLGSNHIVTVWSGGVAVKRYKSSGNVSNQENSDGYYFEDADTGKLVEVSGTVTIEQE